MGGTIIDIYDMPRVNPVVKVIGDNKLDNLSKKSGPVFEEFLRKQIQQNRKAEEQQAEKDEEESKKLPAVDASIVASQYAMMNATIAREEKKPSASDKARAARAYGM